MPPGAADGVRLKEPGHVAQNESCCHTGRLAAMDIALGIDTGGTYTDAVLVDHGTGQVLASAKALTTRHDLAIGIREAIGGLRRQMRCARGRVGWLVLCRWYGRDSCRARPADVVLVGLSTTLATNAMVEGHGGPVCLF